MAFEKAASRTPTSLGDLSVILVDYVATEDKPAHQGIRYEVQVIYNTGKIEIVQGNLAPHIDIDQIQWQKEFIESVRATAEDEILP